MGSITKLVGALDPVTGAVNSLLGLNAPATPSAVAPATPEVKPIPTAAITTTQPETTVIPRSSVNATPRGATTPRARIARGARAATILTADLGDSKLGG